MHCGGTEAMGTCLICLPVTMAESVEIQSKFVFDSLTSHLRALHHNHVDCHSLSQKRHKFKKKEVFWS